MLSQEVRNKKVTFSEHFVAELYNRKSYFPHCCDSKERFKECIDNLRNSNKSMIFEDKRKNVNSSHICMFLNEAGFMIALPMAVNQNTLHLFTVKNVKEDWDNPNWFIDQYNLVASGKNLSTLPYVIR